MPTSTVAIAILACACIGALLSPVESFSPAGNVVFVGNTSGRRSRAASASASADMARRTEGEHRRSASLPTRLPASIPSEDDGEDGGGGDDETEQSESEPDDAEILDEMLRDFLASSHLETAHADFWADDLVYTSSAGSRLDKGGIMSSFDGVPPPDDDYEPDTIFTPQEMDIRVYGDAAVAAFKLKSAATTIGGGGGGGNDEGAVYYYNTGTFLKRGGAWRAVAWQSTAIPKQ